MGSRAFPSPASSESPGSGLPSPSRLWGPWFLPESVWGSCLGWGHGAVRGRVQSASAAEMVAALMRGESLGGRGRMTRKERRAAIDQLRAGLGLADLDRTPQVHHCAGTQRLP